MRSTIGTTHSRIAKSSATGSPPSIKAAATRMKRYISARAAPESGGTIAKIGESTAVISSSDVLATLVASSRAVSAAWLIGAASSAGSSGMNGSAGSGRIGHCPAS